MRLAVLAGVVVAAVAAVAGAGKSGVSAAAGPPSTTSQGNVFVDPATLVRIARAPHRAVTAEEADQDVQGVPLVNPTRCPQPVCGPPQPRFRRPSPKPVSGAYACCAGQLDAQIAASDKGFLVVGMRDHISLYDKGGTPLYPKASSGVPAGELGSPYGDINLCDLFDPIIPDMQAHLGLPTGKTDAEGHKITVRNGYGINCDAATGGVQPPGWKSDLEFYEPTRTIYDARVVWDEYNRRFWIAAIMHNDHTVAFSDPQADDPDMKRPATRSANVRSARRALVAIAVSKSDDPRDGWYLSWIYGYPGQDTCPHTAGCVGFATDYLSVGVTSRFLTIEALAGTVREQAAQLPGHGEVIAIVPTRPLAEGHGGPFWMPKPFPHPTDLLQPAVQHAPDFDHGREALFAVPLYNLGAAGDLIEVLAIEPKEAPYNGVPGVYKQFVPVPLFTSDDTVTQPEKGGATVGVAGRFANKLVYHDSSLFLTMDSCARWSSKRGCLVTGVRVIRLRLDGVVRSHGAIRRLKLSFAGEKLIQQTPAKGAAGATWFGFPALEVNRLGDVVAAYHASSPTTFVAARYSVWPHGEQGFRASRVLKAGQGAAHDSHHYLGMSTGDDGGVWIIDGYGAPGGGWSFAFGKVLGTPRPDLELLRAQVSPLDAKRDRLRLIVDNLGDGNAPHSSVSLTFVHHGAPDIPVKIVPLAPLAHGRHRQLAIRFPTSALAGGGVSRNGYSLKVSLDPANLFSEYDETNNAAVAALP